MTNWILENMGSFEVVELGSAGLPNAITLAPSFSSNPDVYLTDYSDEPSSEWTMNPTLSNSIYAHYNGVQPHRITVQGLFFDTDNWEYGGSSFSSIKSYIDTYLVQGTSLPSTVTVSLENESYGSCYLQQANIKRSLNNNPPIGRFTLQFLVIP